MMNSCTFFGHRDTPSNIEPLLCATLIDLIENKQVCEFYVGNNGNFDNMVRKALQSLKTHYPHIRYTVVLAYLLTDRTDTPANTIYPEGLETVPPKYAISRRNRWMLNQANYVITYVACPFGGAAQYKAIAEKQHKIVINLADTYNHQQGSLG